MYNVRRTMYLVNCVLMFSVHRKTLILAYFATPLTYFPTTNTSTIVLTVYFQEFRKVGLVVDECVVFMDRDQGGGARCVEHCQVKVHRLAARSSRPRFAGDFALRDCFTTALSVMHLSAGRMFTIKPHLII